MGMKKREKKVLGAVGQDVSGSVLDKAKAEMGKSEKRVKKVRVAALASVCAVIIAVLVCLPVLLPHHAQEPQFVPNENLSEIIIGREDLNEEIMFFDTKPQDSALYEYNGKKVFYVEHCNIEGVSVDFIVKFAEGNGDYIFEAEEDIWDNAPEELKMPVEYKDFLKKKGLTYTETTSLEEHLNDCDILYMTRVQQERFTDPMEYEKVKDVYRLDASMLDNVKENMKILHPLPRVGEIDQNVDDSPHAYYFKQAENGLYVRMAIIAYLLGYR